MNMQVTNLDSLLNANLDDLADLPSFEVPVPGHYQLLLDITAKKIGDADAIEFSYEVVDTLELANSEDTPPKPGDKFSEAYMLNNEFGVGKLKVAIKPIAEALGTSSLRDLVGGQVKGMSISATVKRRVDKNDKEKFYAVVSNIIPA